MLTYIPQLNGVTERKNRIILDMARSLLKVKKLPKQYGLKLYHVQCIY